MGCSKAGLLKRGVWLQQQFSNFFWKNESLPNDNNLQESKSCLNVTFPLKSQTSQLIIFKTGISNVLPFLLIKILLISFCCLLVQMVVVDLSTGWLEEFSRSLSHRNYTFGSKKFLLVPSRHSRSLGFQPCIPIFHNHLCTVGHQNFQDQKFAIGLLATQKQIKT